MSATARDRPARATRLARHRQAEREEEVSSGGGESDGGGDGGAGARQRGATVTGDPRPAH